MKKIVVLSVVCLAVSFDVLGWGSRCGENPFSTEVVQVQKISETCTRYELKVSFNNSCRYALSHYTVAIPCGKLKDVSNSENWDIEYGKDHTTGLYGFKIDNIPSFGETRLKYFKVYFTLCTQDSACNNKLSCWEPVVAYKASRCVYYDTLAISCPSLEATLEATHVSCHGAQDGSLTAVVQQGYPPFTYNWSTGAVSQSIDSLPPGTYSITVKDAKGSEVKLTGEVAEPTPIVVSSTIAQPTCEKNTPGSIDLSVSGGKGGYTFNWSNGARTEDLDSLEAGTYSVTVTDTTGCTSQKAYVLSSASMLTIVANFSSPGCNQSNGSLDITVQGGTSPYSYQWSNGSNEEDLNGISAGIYTVTVKDASGCEAQANYNIKENNTLKLSAGTTPAGCNGEATGAIDLVVMGGTPPYAYQWSNGQSFEDIHDLTAGIYSVTVTDSLGCTASLRVSVSKKTFQVSSQIVHPLCAGDSSGSVTLLPVLGNGPYTFLWSTGETTNNLSGLPAGIYSVVVTDATGCSRELFFVLIDPAPIEVNASVSNSQCNQSGFFEIDLNVAGGSPPYDIQWSTGAVSEDLDSLEAGSYSVKVTDSNGCAVTKHIEVSGEPSVISCLIYPPDSAPTCGSTDSLSAVEIDGAIYSWTVESTDNAWTINAGSAERMITYRAGGEGSAATFKVTIEKDGCVQTCSYTISSCESSSGEEDPADDECVGCFNTSISLISNSGYCKAYEAVISTDGNCARDLSHWAISIPCGDVKNYFNSEGWKMVVGKDPKTGLYGLKVDDIHGFGSRPESFTVRFSICYENGCSAEHWAPIVAYKAGLCVGYDSLNVEDTEEPETPCRTYPNPFKNNVTFEWRAKENDYICLEITDSFGHKVKTLYEGQVRKGEVYKFNCDSGNWSGKLYLYRLKGRKHASYGKLLRE